MATIATALAERTADAYSFDRYGSWTACARLLLSRGHSEREAEAILRSKWMRWAADASTARYGKVPASALADWLNKLAAHSAEGFQKDVRELVAGTFPPGGDAQRVRGFAL